MKKIIPLFLSMVLLLLLIPATAQAVEVVASGNCGANGSNVTWKLYSTGELVISGTGAMANYEMGNAPWYSRRDSVKTVVIGNGVTSIGGNAFYCCTKLKTVNFPEGLKVIGESAFSGCYMLSSADLPSTIENIFSFLINRYKSSI